jgi:transposase
MGRVIKIELDDDQRKELEKGYRNGKSHAFRTRCQMILLKSEGRKSQEIASFLGFCQQAVNLWLKRYQNEGINGLLVRAGRGRPCILSRTEDLEAVKEAVKKHRQRISIARAELEETLGKEFSARTLSRYLKILTADINEFADA